MRPITPRFDNTIAFVVPSNDDIAQMVLTASMTIPRIGDLLFFPQPSAPENENVFFLGQWPQDVFIGLLPLLMREMFPALGMDVIFSIQSMRNRHMVRNSQFYVSINDIAFEDGSFLSQYFLELHKRIRFFYNDETPSRLCVEMSMRPGTFFLRGDSTERRLPTNALSFEHLSRQRLFPSYDALHDLWQQTLVPVVEEVPVEEAPEDPIELQAVKSKHFLCLMRDNVDDMLSAINEMQAPLRPGGRLTLAAIKSRIENLFQIAREPWEDDSCYQTHLYGAISQHFLVLRGFARGIEQSDGLMQLREQINGFSLRCSEHITMAEEYLAEYQSNSETPSVA